MQACRPYQIVIRRRRELTGGQGGNEVAVRLCISGVSYVILMVM